MGGCGADNPQGRWLAAELASSDTQNRCTLAFWHGARFFSYNGTAVEAPRGPSIDTKTNAYWAMLQNAGADVVLGGHQHIYERFDRMSVTEPAGATPGDSQGQVDPSGIRQFVVGTGGGEPGTFQTNPAGPSVAVGSQFRLDNQFGVLKLTLHPGSYDWQFLAAGAPSQSQPEGTVLDSGSDTCQPGTAAGGPGTTTSDSSPDSGPGTTPTTATGTPPGNSPAASGRSGYWMVGSDGKVYGFGDAKSFGNAAPGPGTMAMDLEPTPSCNGYWVIGLPPSAWRRECPDNGVTETGVVTGCW